MSGRCRRPAFAPAARTWPRASRPVGQARGSFGQHAADRPVAPPPSGRWPALRGGGRGRGQDGQVPGLDRRLRGRYPRIRRGSFGLGRTCRPGRGRRSRRRLRGRLARSRPDAQRRRAPCIAADARRHPEDPGQPYPCAAYRPATGPAPGGGAGAYGLRRGQGHGRSAWRGACLPACRRAIRMGFLRSGWRRPSRRPPRIPD
ncbi:hypothetical protein D3C78_1298460 [compost metagenome]